MPWLMPLIILLTVTSLNGCKQSDVDSFPTLHLRLFGYDSAGVLYYNDYKDLGGFPRKLVHTEWVKVSTPAEVSGYLALSGEDQKAVELWEESHSPKGEKAVEIDTTEAMEQLESHK